MSISGFTFLRNAHKLYYPVSESIRSILPIVDEFVIALAQGDEGDNSLQLIKEINSPKIKIIDSTWDLKKYKGGTIYAQQTDLAKKHCKGDWLFYLQGDEVIHENDTPEILSACTENINNPKIEGFVLNYLHFYGNYERYYSNHNWYKREIRIIRNLPQIHSWRDAQSFRYHINNDFNDDYMASKETRKLNCKLLKARVFHYGWVRPPHIMKTKNDEVQKNYQKIFWDVYADNFDYGRLDYCKKYEQSHPAIMQQRIATHDWEHLLRYTGPIAINRSKVKHEKTKYRILSWIEDNLLGGYVIGGFKNYKLL
jgi:hypothetical protein